ncbi:MAG: hypothetical protein RLZZ148_102 [Cyanobacteriota bacterium]
MMRKIFSLLAIAFLAVATFVSLPGLAHADQQTNPQLQQEQSFQRNNDQRFQDQCYSQNNDQNAQNNNENQQDSGNQGKGQKQKSEK